MAVDPKSIAALASKAEAKQHWQLAATAAALLADPDSLDRRINLTGAMHEVGLLKNSYEPYWALWRSPQSGWIARCCERLLAGDHDYWALAGLLGAEAGEFASTLAHAGIPLLGVRSYEAIGSQAGQVGIFGVRKSESIIAPVFEIAVGSQDPTIGDAMRWRAVTLSDAAIAANTIQGSHSGAYFMRARLPHGSWRILHDGFELQPDKMVPVQGSIFG